MIGRHHAGLAVAFDLGAVDEIHHRIVAAEIEHEALPGAVDFAIRQAAGATDNRCDVCYRCQTRRQPCACECRFAIFRQPFFSQGHQRDHALIGLLRIGAKTEDAVLDQHQPFDRGIGVERFRCGFRQAKARHHVRHVSYPLAVNLAAQRFAVGLVGEREHRGRMGVVDEFMRNEGMQQRFHGRIGRGRIDQIGALQAHHLFVGKLIAGAKFQ